MTEEREPPRRGRGKPRGTKVQSEKRLGRPPKPDNIKELGWEKFNLNVPPEWKARLEARAAQEGASMSHIIIEAVNRYLSEEG